MDDFDFGGFSAAYRVGDLFWSRGADFGIGPSSPWMSDVAFVSDAPAAWVDAGLDAGLDAPAIVFEDAAVESFVDAPVAAFESLVAQAPLFTAFDWPEQARFAFDYDDAFVAPVRFAGRTFFSWL